jgi:hypothetical protein
MKIVAVISAAGAFANCALGRASRRRRVRTLTAPALGLVLCGLIGARLPATATATSFGVETFEAGTCNKSNCTYKSVEENHAEAYTQADGHPPYGLTGFKLNHTGEGTAELPVGALEGVRVDLPRKPQLSGRHHFWNRQGDGRIRGRSIIRRWTG